MEDPRWPLFEKMTEFSRDRTLSAHVMVLKDGASFCYCAYVLRISGYSDKEFAH